MDVDLGKEDGMDLQDALAKLLRSYRQYYDVRTENVAAPFAAEAEFHSHEEHYFLIRRAVIDEVENNEIVYFAAVPSLKEESFREMDQAAWERGLAKATPSIHHQSSDVSLIILADQIDNGLFPIIKRCRHTLTYKRLLHGYSNYHLIALELSTGRIVHNRLGYTMKRLLRSIADSS